MSEPARERYERYKRAVSGERLPCALVDLEAFDRNVALVGAYLVPYGKKLRIASKSIRCPQLLRRVANGLGSLVAGVMTYTAEETAFLADEGYVDLLLAYPTATLRDAQLIAACNSRAVAAVVVDDVEQLEVLDRAAREASRRIPVVVEIDMSYRRAGGRVHLGVRRSPLHEVADVVAFAERVASHEGLTFHGIMGYEAQIAGLGDKNPFKPLLNAPKRLIKALSRAHVEKTRSELLSALRARGLEPKIFNGGGTGSLAWCAAEDALTEVTSGSAFVASHLFDYYRDISLEAAAYFALQTVRRPGPGMVTCHGGGYVASGEAGPDRSPIPVLPEGLSLTPLEAAGEVQTPLSIVGDVELALGDPVFFRHAKAGELAEHFNEYLLVRGDAVEERAKTYRGLGYAFL